MFRIIGISLAMVGATVAGGMGLSLAHNLFVQPDIVAAAVVQPTRTIVRIDPVQPETTQNIVRIERVALKAAAVADPALVTPRSPVIPVARQDGLILERLSRVPGVEFPATSIRPRLRGTPPEVQVARVNTPRPRVTVPRNVVRTVPRSAPRPRYVPASTTRKVPTASPPNPAFLIGVYR